MKLNKQTIAYLESQFANSKDQHFTEAEARTHNEHLQRAIRAIEVMEDVDTAFELVRVGWEKPNMQAVDAINKAWVSIQVLLGRVADKAISKSQNEKLCHLHLEDGFGNKHTLICYLKNGSISYSFYSGTGSSGIGFALSNLQCTLPIETKGKETREQFVKRLIEIINTKAVERVIHRVKETVTFA